MLNRQGEYREEEIYVCKYANGVDVSVVSQSILLLDRQLVTGLMGSRDAELAASKPQGRTPRAPASPSSIISCSASASHRCTGIWQYHYLILLAFIYLVAREPIYETPFHIRHHVRWPAEAREGLHQGRRQADPGS